MDITDFESLKSDEGAVMTLMTPDDEDVPMLNDDGSPMTIRLLGQDHSRCKRVETMATNQRLSKAGKKGKLVLTKQELDETTIEVLTVATLEWNITLNKAKPECNPENARALYTRHEWVREQADKFAGDRANFMKGASRTTGSS